MHQALAVIVTMALLFGTVAGAASQSQETSREPTVTWDITSSGGMDIRAGVPTSLALSVKDGFGRPITQRTPAAWLVRMPGEEPIAGDACERLVQGYGSRTPLMQPEADLNAYQLVVLGENGTILVLDPLSGFGGSRLLARLDLGRAPLWWTLDHDRGRLLAAIPDVGLAIVTVGSWLQQHVVKWHTPPQYVAFNPTRNQLHVLSGTGLGGTYEILDGETFKTVRSIRISEPRRLALDNQGGNTLIIMRHGVGMVNLFTSNKMALWRPKKEVTAVVWSRAASRFFLALKDGSIAEWRSGEKKATIITRTLIQSPQLVAAPDGRWLFAFNPTMNGVRVYDTASRKWRGTVDVAHPTEISVSETYLYVRSATGPNVVLLPLESFYSTAPFTGKVLTGGTIPHRHGAMSSMAHVAESGLAFWVSHDDGQIYAYHEGMNAPSGSLSAQGERPLGLLVTRSLLAEQKPGLYTAWVTPKYGGRYVVPFMIQSPRVMKCITLTVTGPRPPEELRPQVVPVSWPDTVPVGEPMRLAFRVDRPQDAVPVSELDIMLLSSSGMWQVQQHAHQENGIYHVTAQFPAKGLYWVLFRAPQEQLGYDQFPRLRLKAQ